MKKSFIALVVLLLVLACSVDHFQREQISEGDEQRNSTEIPLSENSINIMVPAYFDPEVNHELWMRLCDQARKMPGRIYAIVNPSNGPGKEKDLVYLNAINRFKSSGGRVLGYVPTGYGLRDISDVESYIDCWYQWYDVDGIFLDEQAGLYQPGYVEHYRDIYTYIKKYSNNLVVGNPGGETRTSYIPYSDVIFRYENTGLEFSSAENGYWINFFNRSNFGAFVYQTESWKECIDSADQLNYGWIYITDDVLDNPWDTLPYYFEEMCNYLNLFSTVEFHHSISADLEKGSYRIRSKYNGKFLDISPEEKSLVVKECLEEYSRQWELIPDINNNYKISSGSYKAELDDELLYNGMNIKTSLEPGFITQNWQLEDTGNGCYKIVSQFSGKVMHQLGSGNVVQADYGGWTNQMWEIIRVGDTPETIIINAVNYYKGTNIAPGGPDNVYGEDVILNAPPYNSINNAAEYRIEVESDGYYKLFIEYAAASSRPVDIYINEALAIRDALSKTTGGWMSSDQKWFEESFIELKKGYNKLVLNRSDVFPHIRSIKLIKE